MPYVSHPVRHVRDDPREGETVDLLVRVADDADQGAVEDALRGVGGEDVDDRGLGALAVTLPQVRVTDVCELDALDAVETQGTLAIDLDGAGEDVEY